MKNYTIRGCRYSHFNVFPKNWESGGKSLLKLDWRIEYYFFDESKRDRYPKGKQITIKGINLEKDLEARRAIVRELMRQEKDLLDNQGYNPIDKTIAPPPPPVPLGVLHEEMTIIEALSKALEIKKCSDTTRNDMRSVVKWTTVAVKNCRLDTLKVGDVKRRHIKMLLDELGVIRKKTWTNRTYNYYRAHLSMLWNEMIEYDAVEYNPLERIKKLPVLQKLRKVLTKDERAEIDAYLRTKQYRFWLLVNIFFHSGARRTEVVKLQGKDVDLSRQVYKTTLTKGGLEKEAERPIKNVAVDFWQQALEGCGPDQYIFSDGLAPGDSPIRPEQFTRRWKLYVKRDLGINKDFYALKHTNTDEVTELLDIEAAARLNSHTSTAVTLKHYAVNESKRQLERIKCLSNSFGNKTD